MSLITKNDRFPENDVCKKCNNNFVRQNVLRQYGEFSPVYYLNYCSARCYTRDTVEKPTPTLSETAKKLAESTMSNARLLNQLKETIDVSDRLIEKLLQEVDTSPVADELYDISQAIQKSKEILE